MTSTVDSLHKILKDETRRKIILLLTEKGNLGYTELMDRLNIVNTGTLNYHLKVLGDLMAKDEAERYTLSEKGQLASSLLKEFPEKESLNKRRWKIYWIVGAINLTMIVLIAGYLLNLPLHRIVIVIIAAQVLSAFTYYIRIKPIVTGRLFYVVVGVGGLGGFFWFLLQLFMMQTGLRLQLINLTGYFGDDLFAFISLLVLWVLGAFVGDWIGKKRNYKIHLYSAY